MVLVKKIIHREKLRARIGVLVTAGVLGIDLYRVRRGATPKTIKLYTVRMIWARISIVVSTLSDGVTARGVYASASHFMC